MAVVTGASSTEVAAGKPAPDLFLHAAERCRVAPQRCVVVEDSEAGVAAAKAAGMRSLGFAGSVTPAARLQQATAVFDEMAQLPAVVRSLSAPG